MPRFWGYISNGQYSVGCTGQTVYVYDSAGKELARFKDIRYGYTPLFSPDGDRLVVKSTEGRLAVYSLTERKLLKKFRFSKEDGGQDYNMCFSPDGKLFYNVEVHPDPAEPGEITFAIGIYETESFTLLRHLFLEDPAIDPIAVQWDTESDILYVLGKGRQGDGFQPFVAILEEDSLCDLYPVSEKEDAFYHGYLHTKAMGFTPLSKEWSLLKYAGYDPDKVEKESHTLSELWLRHALEERLKQ